jgi:hypothetical protein
MLQDQCVLCDATATAVVHAGTADLHVSTQ